MKKSTKKTIPAKAIAKATAADGDTTINTTLLNVTINQFRPLGAVFPISATITMPNPTPGIVVVNGDILVSTNVPENLMFQISGPEYVFIGMAFDTTTSGVDVGADEYPTITIKRWNPVSPCSCLTVTDANLPPNRTKSYAYLLLVQSTATGEIGVIDPMIRNDVEP